MSKVHVKSKDRFTVDRPILRRDTFSAPTEAKVSRQQRSLGAYDVITLWSYGVTYSVS